MTNTTQTRNNSEGKLLVLYITGTRADYGLMVDTLTAIDQHPKLKLSILVTGMHLSEEFGNTVQEVESDGFKISSKLTMLQTEDSPAAMAQSIGNAIVYMSKEFESIKPDFILLEGDRGESLAAAIAAAHMNIAVAHVSGGDVTGTIDESIRHAISKFAHIHFPGTPLSAERLRRMGEYSERIHMVGTPGANLKRTLSITPDEVASALEIDLSGNILLVLQHPVTTEPQQASKQIRETMEAVCSFEHETIVVYPNSDAGGREMIKLIQSYEHLPFVHPFKSLPRKIYIGLLNVASVMIGNSSSALVDAPNFGLPAVNVGTRQRGRERGGNLIDADCDSESIRHAIAYAIEHLDNPGIRKRWRESPYMDVDAAERIADVLSKIEIGSLLIQKRFDDSWMNNDASNALNVEGAHPTNTRSEG